MQERYAHGTAGTSDMKTTDRIGEKQPCAAQGMVDSGTVEGARALLQAVCAINPATSRIRDQVDHTVTGRAWWMTPGPWGV